MRLEQPEFIPPTQEQKSTPIMDFLVKEAEYLRENGFLVMDDCRLETQVEPGERAQKRQEEWGENRNERDGERLEQLTTVVLNEYFSYSNQKSGDDLFVIRSNEHDDTWNATDNFLIDKKTGKILAAFDEVVDDPKGRKFEDKIDKSRIINEKGGARISFTPNKRDDKPGEATPSENIPHLVIRLSKAQLDNAMSMIAKIGTSLTKKTQFMTGVFDIFAKQIESQIADLDKSLGLDRNVANNLYFLEQTLKKAQSSAGKK
ncbi:MAG TPA: hypothetical protein VI432_03065 [Candidatus Paceibacterota bacterium]